MEFIMKLGTIDSPEIKKNGNMKLYVIGNMKVTINEIKKHGNKEFTIIYGILEADIGKHEIMKKLKLRN